MNVQPFSPDFANTKNLSTTTSSASVTLATVDTNTGTLGQGYNCIRIVNNGPNAARVRWGVGTQTALITDMQIPAGNTEIFSKSPDATTIAAICETGTAVLTVTCGEGQ